MAVTSAIQKLDRNGMIPRVAVRSLWIKQDSEDDVPENRQIPYQYVWSNCLGRIPECKYE